MAQQANVTFNAVVYASGGMLNGTAIWTNRSAGFGTGFSNFTEKFVQPSNGAQVKMLFSLDVPIVAAADTGFVAAGTLLRKSTVQVSAWMAADGTSAERTDVYNRLKDLVLSAPVSNGIQNLDPTWG
jgi:hypothetical protein